MNDPFDGRRDREHGGRHGGRHDGRARVGRRSVLLGGAGAVLLAACGVSTPRASDTTTELDATDSGDGPPRIAMVGDSITFMSTEPLRAGFTAQGLEVVTIDAQVGRRMTVGSAGQLYPGTDVVRFIAADGAVDVWVVALGTNDVGQYDDAAEYTEQVLSVVAEVPDSAPLVWVDTWHRDRREACELLNGVLRTVVGARPRSLVVDWFSHGDDAGVVAPDGVHPTDAGTAVFAAVVAAGVRELLTPA
jgi:lysophospholipase L1-like esterase